MSMIEKIINDKDDLIKGNGASAEQIDSAEKQLGIKFATEYKEYLLQFGVVSFDGREFTGITPVERLDVVVITKEERARDTRGGRENYYVIEQTGMDDIVIWQDESGKVYQTYGVNEPKQIFDSLSDYLQDW